MKKYFLGALLLACAFLLPQADVRAETLKIGDIVEFVQDTTCLSYADLRGDNKVAGDNCGDPRPVYLGSGTGVIFGGPIVNSAGINWQVDFGVPMTDYSTGYPVSVRGPYLPASSLRTPPSSTPKVGSVAVSSSLTNVRMHNTLPKITAKILDEDGKPFRGYVAKWSYAAPATVKCALVGYGPSGAVPVAGESSLYPYCVDNYLDINAPARGIIFTVSSGGKTASTTVYLSYMGDKGASGAIMPGGTNTNTNTTNTNTNTTTSTTTAAPGCLQGYIYHPITGDRCNGGGTTTATATNTGTSTNTDPEAPLVNVTIIPGTVAQNAPTTISWTTLRAQSCTSDAFEGIAGSSGSKIINPVRTRAYTVTCVNNLGKSSAAHATVTIGVTGGFDPGTTGGTPPPTENPVPPVIPPVVTPPPVTSQLKVGDTVRVRTEGSLNIRGTATTVIPRIGTQVSGSIGTITEGPITAEGYTWFKIDFKNGVDGYAVTNYLEFYVLPIGFGEGATVSVSTNATDVNVRADASTAAAILGKQKSGAAGKIIGGPITATGFTWWNVDFNSGVDGWIAESYLKLGVQSRECGLGVKNCTFGMFEKMWDIILQIGREHNVCARLMERGLYSDDLDGYVDCAGSPYILPREPLTATQQNKVLEEKARESCEMARDGIAHVNVLGVDSAAKATFLTLFRWSDYSVATAGPANGRPYVSPDQCQTKACVLVFGEDLNGPARLSAVQNGITIPYPANGAPWNGGTAYYQNTPIGYTPDPVVCGQTIGFGIGF